MLVAGVVMAVPASASSPLSVINTITLPADSYPYSVAVAPNGDVYVANLGSNTVSVIDLGSTTPSQTIPVGSYPYGVAVASNGDVYVANLGA